MSINSNFLEIDFDYERLPLCSGAESFIEVNWDIGRLFNRPITYMDLHDLSEILGRMAISFINDMKEKNLISDPLLYIKGDFTKMTLKLAIRDKELQKSFMKSKDKKSCED